MGTRHGKDMKEAVRRLLEAEGATELEYSITGRGKQRWTFMKDGQRQRFTFALTPSPNPSAIQNALAAARRAVRRVGR